MPRQERQPEELETLIFSTSEEADQFVERVEERSRRESKPGVARRREAVSEEVGRELEGRGEPAGVLARPWEHTRQEHEEVQGLVNTAFEEDIAAALKRARASRHYPRVIDLLHDVLTTELYESILQRGLNKQKIFSWPTKAAVAVIAVTAVIIIVLFLV